MDLQICHKGDLRDGFVYLNLTLMRDTVSYICLTTYA